jgi:hypothetical protein
VSLATSGQLTSNNTTYSKFTHNSRRSLGRRFREVFTMERNRLVFTIDSSCMRASTAVPDLLGWINSFLLVNAGTYRNPADFNGTFNHGVGPDNKDLVVLLIAWKTN